MQVQLIDISFLKQNTGQIDGLPPNPRIIKDEKYKKLVKSIIDDPEMINLRELIAYPHGDNYVIICGNMRLRAMQELGYKDAPVKVLDKKTTVEKLKAYTIKDNLPYGEHDWDMIANEWDTEQITDWGLDIPGFIEFPSDDELIGEEKNKPPTMKITFESPEQLQAAENDIAELIDRKYKGAFYSVSAGEI